MAANGASAPGSSRRGVVELVPAQPRAGRAERAVGQQRRLPVAEMQSAAGEAGGVAEQAGHGMARARRVLQPLAQHHEAAALAVHRMPRGERRQPGAEFLGGREAPGMQLRIAAGQPAASHPASGASSASGEKGTISAPARRQPARTCG